MPIRDTVHEHRGPCPCCGNETAATSGRVFEAETLVARYRILWNPGDHSHEMAWLVAFDNAGSEGTISVSVAYSFVHNAFMVLNPEDYLWGRIDTEGCGTLLRRDQVIGTPLAKRLFPILDEIWACDPYVRQYVESQ
jgi:hypothetical protein